MSFLGRMFSRGNPGALVSSQKADETRAYIYSITENARISSPNIESMYAEFCRALDASSIVSNAHDKITSAVSSMKFVITRNGDPIENHPLMALLNRPNPEMSRSLFLASIASSRFLAGTAYIQRTLNRARKPIELWPIRPDKMELKLDDRGHPRAYVMGNPKTEDNVGSISGVHFPIDPVTGQSDIASIRSVNPLNLFFGRSPISGAWNDIQIFVETLQFNYGILRNGGFPSGALVYKGEGELVATQLETFRSMIKTHVKGSENAGTPLVLAKGFEWIQMGLSPDDLSLTLLVEQSSRAISHALGVPALLLGLPGDNTYANYGEARLAFWEDTIIPQYGIPIVDELTRWFSPMFEGVQIELDLEEIPSLLEKRMSQWDRIEKSTSLTVNEKRAALGYAPVEGGDTVFAPSNLIPLNLDGDVGTADAGALMNANKPVKSSIIPMRRSVM